MIDKETVDRMFNYNPETGSLTWKPRQDKRGRPIAKTLNNAVAGYVGFDGYWQVEIDNKPHKVHRLIWLMMTGKHPPHMIDHINLVKTDNRWSNLRMATCSQNQANRPTMKTNRLGVKGVRSTKNGKRYSAQFKNQYIGTFDCPAVASFAFQIEQAKAFGEFARPL